MGLAFPILMLADAMRYAEFSQHRPEGAFRLDAIWIGTQLILLIGISAFTGSSALLVLFTWVAGSTAAALHYCWRFKLLPRPVRGAVWLWGNRDLSFRFFGEYLAISGVQQSVVFASVIFAGISAAAAIRGGQVVLGPLSIFSMGIAVVALPMLSELARQGLVSRLAQRAALISTVLSAVTIVYAAAAMLIPDGVGTALLGDSWLAGDALVPLLALQILANNLAYGATSGLRSIQAAKLSLRLRLASAPLALALVVGGAAAFGATGAIGGATVGGAAQAMMWWLAFGFALKSRGR
jgi:O-antigen/teichoic acid export membrane protein